MTPMQHRAVLVCILCVLAVLLTFGITTTLLKKEEPACRCEASAQARGWAFPPLRLSALPS